MATVNWNESVRLNDLEAQASPVMCPASHTPEFAELERYRGER